MGGRLVLTANLGLSCAFARAGPVFSGGGLDEVQEEVSQLAPEGARGRTYVQRTSLSSV